MTTFLETLIADAENIVEADMPSPEGVRKVLGALLLRVEQLTGIADTKPPMPAAPAEPVTVAPDTPAPAPDAPAPAADTSAPDAPAPPEATVDDTAKQAQVDALKAQLADLEASP